MQKLNIFLSQNNVFFTILFEGISIFASSAFLDKVELIDLRLSINRVCVGEIEFRIAFNNNEKKGKKYFQF
jgi:hypothetical protein